MKLISEKLGHPQNQLFSTQATWELRYSAQNHPSKLVNISRLHPFPPPPKKKKRKEEEKKDNTRCLGWRKDGDQESHKGKPHTYVTTTFEKSDVTTNTELQLVNIGWMITKTKHSTALIRLWPSHLQSGKGPYTWPGVGNSWAFHGGGGPF